VIEPESMDEDHIYTDIHSALERESAREREKEKERERKRERERETERERKGEGEREKNSLFVITSTRDYKAPNT
jgi:hypothetical protein